MRRHLNCGVRCAYVSKHPVTATTCLTDWQYTPRIHVRRASAKSTALSHALRMFITRPTSRLNLPPKFRLVYHLDLFRVLQIYPLKQQPSQHHPLRPS
jgi:hypothetical protein